MFKDRQDAGKKLAKKLPQYLQDINAIALGLPRGGVIVAFEVAKSLHIPLDVLIVRKMGAPYNPELAIGATDEEGHVVLNDEVIETLNVSPQYIEEEKQKQKEEALHRLKRFRGNRPPLLLTGKTALLIDDGLATGATMNAAIACAKAKKAQKVIVAVPVAAFDSLQKLKGADRIICIETPTYFGAVGSFYENFEQTTDEEVIQCLKNLF